ncbi:MAG: adenylyl-sulfate kinase [Nitrospinales bacterium]
MGKANLARRLEEKLFHNNFQSYLLDGRNVSLGVAADVENEDGSTGGEAIRRFGEVAKLFLDAGHVIISTSNVFNQADHSDIRLLVQPSTVLEILVSDEKSSTSKADLVLSLKEAANIDQAVNKIYNHLKEKKILTGHSYSI